MTETDICNMALGRIGEQRIVALTDNNAVAQACKVFYEPTRDEVLRGHRWNFAMERVTLAKLDEAPAFTWACQFQLPSDCLRVCEVNDSEDGRGCPWVVEGRKLLTDEETVNLVYVRKLTDASQYDALFCEALSLKLASKLATKLRGSAAQVANFLQEYAQITAPLARRVDGNENRERKPLLPLRSRFVAARSGGV